MTRRLVTGRLVVAWTVGAAAVAFVVLLLLGVLPHAGTGDPGDPVRALGRTLTAGSTWAGVGIAGLAGLVAGTVHAVVHARRQH